MNKLKQMIATLKAKRELNRVRPIPVTDKELNDLITAAIESTGLDASNGSLRQALASTLQLLPSGTMQVSVKQLKNVLQQARMRQAAYNEIERIRDLDKAAREAAAAANEKAE